MNTQEAARLIRGLTYKPGWTIRATPSWNETKVIVDVEGWVDNSTPREDDRRDRVVASGTFIVENVGLSEAEIEAQVLGGLIGMEIHEAREFLRRNGVSRFHPHRQDGERSYTLYENRVKQGVAQTMKTRI